MAIELTSPAFEHGQSIPRRYTGEGEDVSPLLRWSGVPEGTKEIVLVCDDPDAPTPQPWVHWVLYKIPATVTELPEGIPPKARLKEPVGALQGMNSWHTIGYRGPMPPPDHGPHRYFFRIYAVKGKMVIEPGAEKSAVLREISNHILAEGQLLGTYSR